MAGCRSRQSHAVITPCPGEPTIAGAPPALAPLRPEAASPSSRMIPSGGPRPAGGREAQGRGAPGDRGQLSRAPGRCLALAAALTLAPVCLPVRSQDADRHPDDFGRWQQSSENCRIVRVGGAAPSQPPTPVLMGCGGVRLDQRQAGLLGMGLLGAGSAGANPQLLFAGELTGGSRALRCRAGRCSPDWPLQLRVIAVASGGIPPAHREVDSTRRRLARGHCWLDAGWGHCQVESGDQLWLVELRW